MKMKILYLLAHDHFTTDSENEDDCIQEAVGILEYENERYYKLRYLTSDILVENPTKEINNVLKSEVAYKKEFEFDNTFIDVLIEKRGKGYFQKIYRQTT